jgi:hypothetical protein
MLDNSRNRAVVQFVVQERLDNSPGSRDPDEAQADLGSMPSVPRPRAMIHLARIGNSAAACLWPNSAISLKLFIATPPPSLDDGILPLLE